MDSDYAASKWAGGVHYAALQASSDEQHHTLAVPRGVVHWTSSWRGFSTDTWKGHGNIVVTDKSGGNTARMGLKITVIPRGGVDWGGNTAGWGWKLR